MTKKNRLYIIITGVVAITLIWFSPSNRNQEPRLKIPSGEEITSNTFVKTVDTLEGILWSSDNETRGNLMVANKNTTVYLRTSRDFSGLVGKHVIVSIAGSLDNFVLLDIEENLAKDGFIKVQ